MTRTVLALVAQTALALLIALLLLGAWLRVSDQETAVLTAEAPRLLFLFMDIGLAVWAVLLVVAAVRRRALPGIGFTVGAAAIGVAANALTVFVVGVAQGSGVLRFSVYALEAGVAFLVAVVVAAPVIRLLVKPPRPAPPPA